MKNISLLFVTHKQFLKDKNGTWTHGASSIEFNSFASRFKNVGVLANVKDIKQIPPGHNQISSRIRIHRITKQYQHYPFRIRFFPLLMAFLKTLHICKKWQYDIVIGKTPGEEGLGGIIGARFAEAPSILRLVGDPLHSPKYRKNVFTYQWIKFASSIAFRNASLITPMSPHLGDLYIDYTGIDRSGQVRAIPDPIFASNFFNISNNVTSNKRKTILYLGRLTTNKNVVTILRAIHLLLMRGFNSSENFILKIVGKGPEKENLLSTVSKLGLQEHVEFVDWVAQSEVPKFVAQSYVLVLPSFSEGFGNVIVQAMAAGIPVIASNRDGPKHIIRNRINGFLFEPLDVEDLASKLGVLLDDTDLAQSMGRIGKEIAQREYECEAVLDKWAHVFAELLEKRK